MINQGRFLSIPVLSVALLLSFVYCLTIFVSINDWVGLQSSAGLLNASIFTLLALLCIFSFIVCVLTDPGGIPSSYAPDIEENEVTGQRAQKNATQLRICDKCHTYKPPRAHHCRVCRRCILRMDHHCAWINSCVGFRNYKAFIVLVFYAAVASIYSTAMIIYCSLGKDWNFSGVPSMIFFVTFGAMMVGLNLTLGTLFGWHVYLLSHNMTTIEYYEVKRSEWLARKSGMSYHHPYNIGIYKNITSVLGPNMLKWLCPTTGNHMKDGISFPRVSSCKLKISRFYFLYKFVCVEFVRPPDFTIRLLTSQYGDSEAAVRFLDGISSLPISELLKVVFGFRHDFLGIAGLMVLVFCAMFAVIFAFSMELQLPEAMIISLVRENNGRY